MRDMLNVETKSVIISDSPRTCNLQTQPEVPAQRETKPSLHYNTLCPPVNPSLAEDSIGGV